MHQILCKRLSPKSAFPAVCIYIIILCTADIRICGILSPLQVSFMRHNPPTRARSGLPRTHRWSCSGDLCRGRCLAGCTCNFVRILGWSWLPDGTYDSKLLASGKFLATSSPMLVIAGLPVLTQSPPQYGRSNSVESQDVDFRGLN